MTPAATALATGVPAPSSAASSAPSNAANPIPNTWQTTTPPILGPDGIQVHGFRMDAATVKLGAVGAPPRGRLGGVARYGLRSYRDHMY